jgi:hypothetical protein
MSRDVANCRSMAKLSDCGKPAPKQHVFRLVQLRFLSGSSIALLTGRPHLRCVEGRWILQQFVHAVAVFSQHL